MGFSLIVTVCLSCAVMASVFFTVFPQKVSVNYGVNMEQINQIIYGKTLIDNFNKLKSKDQIFLEKATEETIRKLFSNIKKT